MPKKEKPLKAKKLRLVLTRRHDVLSVPVEKDADFDQVMKDAREMIVLMATMEKTLKVEIYALAHSQVTKKHPLRFFVLNPYNQRVQHFLKEQGHSRVVYMNPVIVDHTKVPVDSSEGCVTYVGQPNVTVPRFNKCNVDYQTFKRSVHEENDGVETTRTTTIEQEKIMNEHVSGLLARIFQHEIDHFDAQYVYPKEK